MCTCVCTARPCVKRTVCISVPVSWFNSEDKDWSRAGLRNINRDVKEQEHKRKKNQTRHCCSSDVSTEQTCSLCSTQTHTRRPSGRPHTVHRYRNTKHTVSAWTTDQRHLMVHEQITSDTERPQHGRPLTPGPLMTLGAQRWRHREGREMTRPSSFMINVYTVITARSVSNQAPKPKSTEYW